MNDEQVSIRLPRELLDLAEKLAGKLASRPEHRLHRITRVAILRMAIERGLLAMEDETKRRK